MKKATEVVTKAIMEFLDNNRDPQAPHTTAKRLSDITMLTYYICDKLQEEGLLLPQNQVESNEILFGVEKEREDELIQLCENHMYFLKERREDGSMVFRGNSGKMDETNKMIIGVSLIHESNRSLLESMNKWIWTNGEVEEDAYAEMIAEGTI